MTPAAETRAWLLRRLTEDAGELATTVRLIDITAIKPTAELTHAIDLADRVAAWAELAQQVAGREDGDG